MGDSTLLSPIQVELTPNAGDGPKRRITLQPGKPALIGRASKAATANTRPNENNTWFDCPVMSRKHAELEAADDCVKLTDLGSMHGTYVNGMPLVKLVPIELKNGDKVQLGSNVSRGQDFYRGINMTIRYDVSDESPRTGSSTFSVPLATTDDEDEESEYDYGDIYSDSELGMAFAESSPATSSQSVKDVLGNSPQMPITIDVSDEKRSIMPFEELLSRTKARPQVLIEQVPELSATAAPSSSVQQAVDDHVSVVSPSLLPPVEIQSTNTFSPIFPIATERNIETLFADITDELIAPAKSPNKMTITSILAPAIETQHDVLSDMPEHPSANPDQDATSTYELTGDRRSHKSSGAKFVPICKKRKRPTTTETDVRDPTAPLPSIRDVFANAAFLTAEHDDPDHRSKRRCTHESRSAASCLVRETAKYTFGAAVGAMSTFAFLASPLGGRFADWLSAL